MQLCLQVRVLAAVQVHAGVQYTAVHIYVLHINVPGVLPVFVWTNDVEVSYQGSVDNYNQGELNRRTSFCVTTIIKADDLM